MCDLRFFVEFNGTNPFFVEVGRCRKGSRFQTTLVVPHMHEDRPAFTTGSLDRFVQRMNLLAFILILRFAAGTTPVPTPTPKSISGDINADFLQRDALRGSAASDLEQRAAAVPEQ